MSNYLLPPGAAITGRSAAYLYGAPTRDADDEVEVLSPKAFGPMKGLTVHGGNLSDEDIRRSRRLVMTSPERTCWDLARWIDSVEAVVALDVLVANRAVTVSQLIAYAEARSEQPGWSRLLKAARLVDAASESPQESRLRAKLILAGAPRPVSQFIVIEDGQFLARVDFAWDQ